jgi:hypothetical protein
MGKRTKTVKVENRVVATIIAEVLRVPDRPGCPLKGKRAVKTYPSRETVITVFSCSIGFGIF